jgi:hypothetical protein
MTQKLIEDYGYDLETKKDNIDGLVYKKRLFCVDCKHYKKCRGAIWNICVIKELALKEIRQGT